MIAVLTLPIVRAYGVTAGIAFSIHSRPGGLVDEKCIPDRYRKDAGT
jgi:hypothetical protein